MSELVVFDAERVSKLVLPRATKDFLVRRGLRNPCRPGVSFAAKNGSLPTLAEHCRENGLPVPQESEGYYRFGTDEGTELCIKIADGSVISIDPCGEHITRYVNAGIELFVAILDVYDRFCEVGPTLPEDEVGPFIDSIVREMRQRDPSAFRDSENWWATIVEEIESGMG